jgi:hypothetical protein
LLTTRSSDWDLHWGQTKFTSSSGFINNFSNISPQSRHLNSKIGIVLLPLSDVKYKKNITPEKGKVKP